MISVVIPTCNRPSDLNTLLQCLIKQDIPISETIVVDSSDNDLIIASDISESLSIKHIRVGVKSAAIQRNIGLDQVSESCSFLSFLDDDVKPDSNYLSNLVKGLKLNNGIGISGIAINPEKLKEFRVPPTGAFGTLQRIFFLDSRIDGVLLKSGVNIPIRKYSGPVTKVEWLIGCSVWDFNMIKKIRFEADFMGTSLGEDVIFSVRASKLGTLFVDPSTHLWHTESDIGRQKGANFWAMWVVNRKRLVAVSSSSRPNYIYFHFANLGQILSLIYSAFRSKTLSKWAFLGILKGYIHLLISVFKK